MDNVSMLHGSPLSINITTTIQILSAKTIEGKHEKARRYMTTFHTDRQTQEEHQL